MARQDSLSVLLDPSGQMKLAEVYNGVIENLETELVSGLIKNQELSGNPEGGSLEAKRFANAEPQDYGTARTARSGDKVKGKPVVINIDTDREIVEEVETKDVMLLGVDGFIERRAANHPRQMARELDTAFFSEAVTQAVTFTAPDGVTAIEDIIESAIVTAESTKNAYVDGVPRELLSVTCTPQIYSAMRKFFDVRTNNTTYDASNKKIPETYHGVRIMMSLNLPTNTDFVVMVDGAVAQPVLLPESYKTEEIPLSKAIAIELFYSYGTKAVTPDLIWKKASA